MSQLTGADVAASNDLTGSAALRRDGELEVKTKSIESSLAFAPEALASSSQVLPNSFGYSANATTYQAIDLIPGASGVVTLLDDVDEGSAAINLGANTFNFFGDNYTGSTLYVSSNGLITFNSGDDSYNNTDLSSGSLAAIAPFWDDWHTGYTTADQVLYKIENNKLIVEWSNVQFAQPSAPDPIAFQAILPLNTGSTPAEITFNYVDLDGGNTSVNNGASATVGIKNSNGDPLLVSYNSGTNPLIGSGKAIKISALAPVLSNNFSIPVNQNSSVTITSAILQTTDQDNTPAQLKYTLTNLPSNGSLLLNGTVLAVNGSFSQDDINNNRITYNHNGSQTTSDGFGFTVTDTIAPSTTIVSVASDGTAGNSYSSSPAISADGRYVTFSSDASNLVSGDTNGQRDIFVRDLLVGTTTRLSVASDGTQGNSYSSSPAISADGRYVTFVSLASNLVSGDTNGSPDIFVRDLLVGTTSRVSVATDGTGIDTFVVTDLDNSDTITITATNTTNQLISGIPGAVLKNFENFDLSNSVGTVKITGGTTANIISSGGGNDTLNGGAGNDTLDGSYGNDNLIGGTGIDKMFGGADNDTYSVDHTSDTAIETDSDGTDAGGTDTVSSTVSFTLGAYLENLTLTGSASINGTGNGLNNTITGNSAANTITGGAGDDILNGGAGADILTGNAGADTLTGGTGNDKLYLGLNDNAVDIVNYGSGDGADIIYQFVRGVGGDRIQFTSITNLDVVTSGTNTLLRVGDGITGNTGFGTGQLLATLSATSGFTNADVNQNLFGSNFLFS